MARLPHLLGRARWALSLGVALACAGCGDDAAEAGSPGTGGAAGATSGPTALSFEPSETLTLVPGEVRSAVVVATPPGHYTVRFALLGDSKDAALDKSETVTDAAGRAEVAVTAPSSATTFSLRASADEAVTTSIGVSVSASGFGSLQVNPAYGGKRSVSHWVASVRTGVTCAELSGSLLIDGDLTGKAPFGKVPQVDDVPVGPALAVTLRGAESIAGCKEVTDLRAGDVGAVTVPVFDLPITLAGAELDLVLGLEGGKGQWAGLLGVDAALAAFSPSSNDAEALLDAMQASTADAAAAAAFQAARKSGNWGALVQGSIGGTAGLRALVKPWLAQGAESFGSKETFRGRLTSAEGNPAKAWLELTAVAGADPTEAGFPKLFLASWQANPDDSVALGIAQDDLSLLSSRLLASLALGPAKAQVAGASSVADALGELASCKQVAQALVSAGSGPGEAFAKCDASCAESLCRAGLELLWSAARDASAAPGAPNASLSVAATAAATVNDFARPSAFQGTWVGSFSAGGSSVPVGGEAAAKAPGPPQ